MRLISGILLITAMLGFASCETDFEVNAEWKEIGLAYMILDGGDSVQYLKLNKLYQNTDGNANEIAQIEDSIYFDDENISARLIEGQNTIPLYRVKIAGKSDGVFANPDQWVYRTPQGYILDDIKPFKLEIENTKTGYLMSSDIKIAKNGSIRSPIATLTRISFATCDNDEKRNLLNYIDRTMLIVSGKKVKFYDFDAVFHYAEVDTAAKDTVFKQLNWIIGRGLRAQSDNGGAEISSKIKGEAFFDYIALKLEPVDGIKRIATEMEFVFVGGGQEMYDYINVNQPSIGIVQKRPEYTNIENGLGLFSSRVTQRVSFPFDGCTKYILAKGEKTGHLGFVR